MKYRPVRSQAYQYTILEIPVDHDILGLYSNEKSISSALNPFQYSEELMLLKDELAIVTWELCNRELTKRQLEVISLMRDGYTQHEIANALGVNQSSVTKSISGNIDYKNGGVAYGGSIKKLRKLIKNDPKIQEILKRIEDLTEEVL